MISETLEFRRCSLDVDISYHYEPAEPMVMYYSDGSGYPGSPESAECVAVYVTAWTVEDADRKRGEHWIWDVLQAIATRYVEDHWGQFEEACLEDHTERNDQ